MVAISENFGALLEPILRKVFVDMYKQIPQVRPRLYSILTSKKAQEHDISVGGFGDFPEFTGTVSYDDVYQGYQKTYTHREFAKGFAIERKLWDDDQYSVMKKRAQGLAIAAARRQEVDAASVFNNAFSADYPGGDGVALCATNHPSTAPGVAVQSNVRTAAFSHTALAESRRLMRDFRGDRGERIFIRGDLLLVPPTLEEQALVVLQSEKRSGTADNDANIFQLQGHRIELVVWDYLTDANNWFLIDSAMMKQFLLWFDRVKLEFGQDVSFDTFQSKFRAYFRASYGFSDWRWVYGHNVA